MWSRDGRRVALGALLAIAPLACSRHERPHEPPVATSVVALDAADGPRDAASSAAEDGGAALAWDEAIRRGEWATAWTSIERLPASERSKPATRYAAARVALKVSRPADARAALENLEQDLPLLRERIVAARADAEEQAGPPARAADLLAQQPSPSAWLRACVAYEKAGDAASARAQCTRVIASAQKSDMEEERARELRLDLSGDGFSVAAVADARWLASRAVDNERARKGRARLAELDKAHPVTAEEHYHRGRLLAGAGRVTDALKELELAASAKGKVSATELCRARAEAYYKSREHYVEAAAQYRKCAQSGDELASHDLFYAARALMRAERDGEATAALALVIRRDGKGKWGEQATFHLARMHALAGRWSDAARELDRYLKQFPKGPEQREAERYRALATLQKRDFARARVLLEDLAGKQETAVDAARWGVLAALAASRDGDKTHAVARWTEIARSRSLTWPALVARARLREANAPIPPAIEPAESEANASPTLSVTLPAPVDVLHATGLEDEAEEELHAREATVASSAGGRGVEALCRAYGMLGRARFRYQLAPQIPRQLLSRAPSPASAWAWDCAYPRPFDAGVARVEASHRLPPGVVYAVMRQESGFRPSVVSPARAVGLLQLMPSTAARVATSAGLPHDATRLTEPFHNIDLGTRYLSELLAQTKRNVVLAVAAYNAGAEAVSRWRAHARGMSLDAFVERIPYLETRSYVALVLGNVARYAYLAGGEAALPEIDLEIDD